MFYHQFNVVTFLLVILLAGVVWRTGFAVPNKRNAGKQDTEFGSVKEFSDQFIKRFHETMDIRSALGDQTVSDLVQRLGRKKLADLLDLSPELANTVDEESLSRAYVAWMNFVHGRAIYSASKLNERHVDEDRLPLPAELESAIKGSRQLRSLLSSEGGDAPIITTDQELKQYVNDLERVTALYKKHLPPKVFDSHRYRANIKSLRQDISVEQGNDYFNVDERTKVYIVRRDVFTMYFLNEYGRPRLIGFQVGN